MNRMRLFGFPLLLALSAAAVPAARAAVPADQIPTFQWRARILASGGQPVTNGAFKIGLLKAGASATGHAWSEWQAFDLEQAKVAVGPHSYPNDHIRGWPIVLRFSFNGVAMPAEVEAEVKFTEAPEAVVPMKGNLYGGSMGFLVWRDEGKPKAASMRDYNRKYWSVFESNAIPAAERPQFFPIADRYIHGDGDQAGLEEGIGTLAKGGFSAIMMGADERSRAILLKTGLSRISWAVYNPPGYAFDYGGIGQKEIDDFAEGLAGPYQKAGFKPGDMALFCLSDEPGWYYPGQYHALTNSPDGLARFREYVKAQGLKPKDVGAGSWEQVFPIGRSKATDAATKTLFYWTCRFFPWDSARHFARTTRALEQAFYTNMPIMVNWNFFSGRSYVPGPVANNGAKQDPDAAMGGHDWLEFGRMRGCTMLWTEDWFGDQQAYQWSYYCARMRAGARLGGVRFGGYVIPRTAGSREEGILQKILAIVGSGGKGLKYFVFGPEYVFPGNCYSENVKVLPRMVEAHRMIGKAESLLWPGERPFFPVGLLMPRSAQMWDAKDIALPKEVSDATNTDLNRSTVDYMAEVFNLYLALQHENIPAEIVDEDDLTEKALADYKVLYVTEPNIPVEGQKALVKWVKAGGILVTVCGAGSRDRYDEPASELAGGLGYAEQAPPRMIVGNTLTLPAVPGAVISNGTITAIGARSEIQSRRGKVEAVFADGKPALVRNAVGKGVSLHFPWFPGLSYWRSQTGTVDRLPQGWNEALRKMIVQPVREAGLVLPATADRPMVETPVLVSEAGAAVTLLNWSGAPIDALRVSVAAALPGPVTSVESVKKGRLPFEAKDGKILVSLPLEGADILMIRK